MERWLKCMKDSEKVLIATHVPMNLLLLHIVVFVVPAVSYMLHALMNPLV